MEKLGGMLQNLRRGSADAQLHEAVRTGDAKQVGKTLRRRSSAALIDSVDTDGRTPLHVACITGSAQSATLLLEAGASVDALDFEGRTPLMCASSKNSKLCCKALLDYGANVFVKQRGTMATALHFALGPARADKFEEVVRLLLRGSDVNATCEPGQKTPLMLAVENQHLKCAVHILSTRRVNANVADDHGNTILFYAVDANLPALVRELVVVHNADTSVRNHEGMTASDLAIQLRHYDCQAALGDYSETNQDTLSQHVASDMQEPVDQYAISNGEYYPDDTEAEAEEHDEEEDGVDDAEYEKRLPSPIHEEGDDDVLHVDLPSQINTLVPECDAAIPPPKPERYSCSRSNSSENITHAVSSRSGSVVNDEQTLAQKFTSSRSSSYQSLNQEAITEAQAMVNADTTMEELQAEVTRLQDAMRTERETCDAVLEQLQITQAENIKLRMEMERAKANQAGGDQDTSELEEINGQDIQVENPLLKQSQIVALIREHLQQKEQQCEQLAAELEATKQRMAAAAKEHAREVEWLRAQATSSTRSASQTSLSEGPVSVKNRIGMFQEKAEGAPAPTFITPTKNKGVLGKVHMFQQKSTVSEDRSPVSRQQLQTHKEEIQAKDQEIAKLKKRIASLEEQLAAAEGREGSELELAAARSELRKKQQENEQLTSQLEASLREHLVTKTAYDEKIHKLQARITDIETATPAANDSTKLGQENEALKARVTELEMATETPAPKKMSSINTMTTETAEPMKWESPSLKARSTAFETKTTTSFSTDSTETPSLKARMAVFERKDRTNSSIESLSASPGVRGAISLFEQKASESRNVTPQKHISLTSYGSS